MTAFATQTLDTQTGAPPTFSAVAASDDVECPVENGSMMLVFKGGAGSNTIGITMARLTQYGETYPAPGAPGYTLGTTATTLLFIPLYPDFNNGSGRVTVTNSAPTGVTMAVVKTF